MLKDRRFAGELSRSQLASACLEVWIEESRETVNSWGDELAWGEWGVVGGNQATFFLPAVPILKGYRSAEELARRLSKKALVDRICITHRSRWLHFVDDGKGRVLEYARLCPKDGSFAKHVEAAQRLRSAGRHLCKMQYRDGAYVYSYDPCANAMDRHSDANPLRVIATAYGMGRLAGALERCTDVTPDRAFRQSAKRCFEFMLRQIRYSAARQTFVCSRDNAPVSLGVTAFCLLALQQEPLAKHWSDVRDKLMRSLLAHQRPKGWFEARRGHHRSTINQDFYPGEALLACGHELLAGRESISRSELQRAFHFYREWFRGTRPSVYFVAWQVKAWSTLFAAVPDETFASFVFEMLDWLALKQFRARHDVPADFRGGFNLGPESGRATVPSFITASFAEAFLKGHAVARCMGDRGRARRYGRVGEKAIQFLLRLQIVPEQSFVCVRPECAVGAFRRDLASFEIRCDYNLHAITALCEYMDYESKSPALRKEV